VATIRLSNDGTAVTAALEGEVDVASMAALQQSLWSALQTAKVMVIDLQAVESIDFSGVQLLWWARTVAADRAIDFSVRDSSASVLSAARVLEQGWLAGEPGERAS
jgi:anti-anti-sigma factor